MGKLNLDRALVLGMALLGGGLAWVIEDAFQEPVVNVGDTAPEFRITTDGGRRVTRSEFGGKVLVLNFWATWCPPCIEELPSLNAFQKQLGPSGVVVLAISVDRNEKSYRRFLDRAGLSFETARDPGAEVSSSYGTYKYPETYVIDRRGRVVQKHIGPRNWVEEGLLKEIRSLL